MTPENWPAPDTHCWDEDEERDVWSYSKDQVREIVRMEVEAIAKLVKAEWLTEADREYGARLAALIRAKIKESKDAD